MKTPQTPIEPWAQVERRRATVTTFRERLHDSAEAANLKYAPLLKDPVFARHPRQYQQSIRDDFEREIRASLSTALGVAINLAEREANAFEPMLRAFKQRAQRPVDPEAAWLLRSNEIGVSAEKGLLLQLLHETRVSRWSQEAREWTPSEVLKRWHQAQEDPTDQLANSFIAFADERYGDGWNGKRPTDGDVETIAELRKAIHAARSSRIPPEVAEMEAGLDELRKVVGRVRSLDKIAAINPDQHIEAKETYETELAAADTEAAAAAQAGAA